jgi:hypothetical protein
LRNDIRNALQKKRPENAHFVLEAINSGNKYVDLEQVKVALDSNKPVESALKTAKMIRDI